MVWYSHLSKSLSQFAGIRSQRLWQITVTVPQTPPALTSSPPQTTSIVLVSKKTQKTAGYHSIKKIKALSGDMGPNLGPIVH